MAQSGSSLDRRMFGARDTAAQVTLALQGRLSRTDEVEVKNVEAEAHRAVNDDCLLGVFAHLDIQRDDEHLSLRLWCPTSKPIFDLPRTMNTSTRSAMK
jgi:hypothetical protein